jgi:hypothetical protein
MRTTPTYFDQVAVYDHNGHSITRRFNSRFDRFIDPYQPFGLMLYDANQSWMYSYGNMTDNDDYYYYDGSENIMNAMEYYKYKESGELDAYIRWLNIDYEYTYTDVALNQYGGPYWDLPLRNDPEIFVTDPRGFASVLQPLLMNHSIDQDIIFNTIVRISSKLRHLFICCRLERSNLLTIYWFYLSIYF